MHKSQEVLVAELKKAMRIVPVGGTYFHYKNTDITYEVLDLAITEADDEICVIYQAQYGARLTFVRPLDSWLSKVEWNGKTTNRFSPATG